MIIDRDEFAADMRRKIVPLLDALGCKVKKREQKAAARRAAELWPKWAPSYQKEAHAVQLDRWADDGGNTVISQ